MSPRRAGRVGRPHGLDGSFYVDAADAELLREGAALLVGGRSAVVVRRAGTDERPIVAVGGVEDRDAAAALRGTELESAEGGPSAASDEWDVAELVGCEVPGVGVVRGVIAAPSCDLLEVGEAGVLVPLVADAVRSVDTAARVIEVDLRFLGVEAGAATGPEPEPPGT